MITTQLRHVARLLCFMALSLYIPMHKARAMPEPRGVPLSLCCGGVHPHRIKALIIYTMLSPKADKRMYKAPEH